MTETEAVQALRRLIAHCIPEDQNNQELFAALDRSGVRVAKYILGEIQRRKTIKPTDEMKDTIKDVYFNFC